VTIDIGDPVVAAVAVLLFAALLWVVAYAAARVAIGDADPHGSMPFVVAATADAGAAHLSLTNVSGRTAFRIEVRLRPGTDQDAVSVEELLPGATFAFDVARAGPPDEPRVPLVLSLVWRTDPWPTAPRRRGRALYLGPSRLAAREQNG